MVYCGFYLLLDYNVAVNWIFRLKVFKIFIFDEIYEKYNIKFKFVYSVFYCGKEIIVGNNYFIKKYIEDVIFGSYVYLDLC